MGRRNPARTSAVYSLGLPVSQCLLLPRGVAKCLRNKWVKACISRRILAQVSGRAMRGLHEAPPRLFSLENFQEALKCRQGKGGCPILEVHSLVIYSSTWALELQSQKYITHAALPCVKEDGERKGGQGRGIPKLRRSLGVTGLQTRLSPPSFSP